MQDSWCRKGEQEHRQASSIVLDSSRGDSRDFKGILCIWRPCFRRKKKI